MIDQVLSYHANPNACGVTKFNHQLAEKLRVPHDILRGLIRGREPLVSLKWSEIGDDLPMVAGCMPFHLLWHDRHPDQAKLNRIAVSVSYADELGCPSTLRGDSTRKGLTIFTFGMSKKFQAPLFEQLQVLLDATQQAYTICVSSAIHEGSPWDETTAAHERNLRDIFGDHLRWLGFLADDAVARELRDAHMIALFYDPAVRANNTTLWAALDAGTPVVTNLDAQSPPELVHNKSVFDLAHLTEWPNANLLREVRWGGRKAAEGYTWERFIEKLQAVHA